VSEKNENVNINVYVYFTEGSKFLEKNYVIPVS